MIFHLVPMKNYGNDGSNGPEHNKQTEQFSRKTGTRQLTIKII